MQISHGSKSSAQAMKTVQHLECVASEEDSDSVVGEMAKHCCCVELPASDSLAVELGLFVVLVVVFQLCFAETGEELKRIGVIDSFVDVAAAAEVSFLWLSAERKEE